VNISSCKIFKYNLPLIRPLIISGQKLNFREGLICEVKSSSDVCGYGEIAPLPCFSKESLSQAKIQIQLLKNKLVGQAITKHFNDIKRLVRNIMSSNGLPSVQCGLEMALLNLFAKLQGKDLCSVLAEDYNRFVPMSLLLEGKKAEVCSRAQAAVLRGCPSFKLKVGRNGFKDDIETIISLEKILDDKARLRIDANRHFDFNQAINLTKKINNRMIDYFEEPLNDFSELGNFYSQTNIPIAIDETLIEQQLGNVLSLSGLKAIIIKPTLLGGFLKAIQISQAALSKGIKPIISSTFESNVGLLALLNLAAAQGTNGSPAGLDTSRWFQDNLMEDLIAPNDFAVDIDKINAMHQSIAFDKLTELR